jgi:Rrf2 family protein
VNRPLAVASQIPVGYYKSRTESVSFQDGASILDYEMLKLTKKADYGLIALKHLTVVRPRSASAKEIADRYGVPVPVLSKVLQKLARSGFLTSEHGTNGGYRLFGDPSAITVLDVIRAIDGPVFLTSCFTEGGEDCEHQVRCNVRDPLRRVHEEILSVLARMSMAQLAADADVQANAAAAPSAYLKITNPNLNVLNP